MIQDKGKASQGTETGKSKLESHESISWRWNTYIMFFGLLGRLGKPCGVDMMVNCESTI